MLFKFAFSLSALLTTGCSIHPLPDDVANSRKNTFEIVQTIRCEAKRGVMEWAQHARFNGAVIGYAFDFDIQEDNEMSAELTLKKTFHNGSIFTLPWKGGKATKTRKAQRQFTVVDKFEDLRSAECRGVDIETKNFVYPATGSIGLYEVVSTFARIETQTNIRSEDKVKAFSDTLTFTTEFVSGSLKPELELNSLPTGKLKISAAHISGSSGRKDIHKLTIALALAEGAELGGRRTTSSADTRSALKAFSSRSPVVSFRRSSTVTDIDVQSADDATARVLLELARRRQLSEDDQRLKLLLELIP